MVSVADVARALLKYRDPAVIGALHVNAPASKLAGACRELAPQLTTFDLLTDQVRLASGTSKPPEDEFALDVRVAQIARLQALASAEVKQQFDDVGAALRSAVASTVEA